MERRQHTVVLCEKPEGREFGCTKEAAALTPPPAKRDIERPIV
jgi:hypothetical protein